MAPALPMPAPLPPPSSAASRTAAPRTAIPPAIAHRRTAASIQHAALVNALAHNPQARLLLDTSLAYGSLSFRAVEPPLPEPSVLQNCCRCVRNTVSPSHWLSGWPPAERELVRSGMLSIATFLAFVGTAYSAHYMPKWTEGGSTLTYSVVAAAIVLAWLRRLSRRVQVTARALRWRTYNLRVSAVEVASVLLRQGAADLRHAWRSLLTLGPTCGSSSVWTSLVLSSLLFGLFVLLAQVGARPFTPSSPGAHLRCRLVAHQSHYRPQIT